MVKMEGLNPDALARFAAERVRGPFVMLNLLKFKPDGGRERFFEEYASVAMPMVEKFGARPLYVAECGELLIGDQEWDVVAAVEYPAVGPLIDHLNSPAYR